MHATGTRVLFLHGLCQKPTLKGHTLSWMLCDACCLMQPLPLCLSLEVNVRRSSTLTHVRDLNLHKYALTIVTNEKFNMGDLFHVCGMK